MNFINSVKLTSNLRTFLQVEPKPNAVILLQGLLRKHYKNSQSINQIHTT